MKYPFLGSYIRFLGKGLLLLFCIIFNEQAKAYPFIGIKINGGASITNSPEVTIEISSIKIDDKLIKEMQIANESNFNNQSWLNYSNKPIKFELTPGDGEKNIWVRLKDKEGNVSPAENAKIILDTQPPEAKSLEINNGAAYTNNQQMKVLLELKAEGATKMQISNEPGFENVEWKPYKPRIQWLIGPPGDGKKVVFARFADAANNYSSTIKSSIELDTKPPHNCTIEINEDAKTTNKFDVKVKVQAEGASKLRLIDRTGQEQFFDFSNTNVKEINWTFDKNQGLKIIRAYFVDEAQNFTQQIVQDDIILDTQPPKPPIIKINNGATHTNNANGIVSLRINTKENPTDFLIHISNDKNIQHVEGKPFQAIFDKWQLDADADGEKFIWASLQDPAGNISEVNKASIILDRKPPVIERVEINGGASITNKSKVNIRIEASGADFMQISTRKDLIKGNDWHPFSANLTGFQLPLGNGEKRVFIILRDKAGNVSKVSTANIILDENAPQGAFALVNNQQFVNKRAIQLKFKTADATHFQISHLPTFNQAEWIKSNINETTYQLPDEDGAYKIFFRLKDAVGNISEPLVLPVFLDRAPPQAKSLLINNGAEWFNRVDMKVTLAFNVQGADEVMISNNKDFDKAKWQESERTIGWILDGTKDGKKTVYAKFRDRAGNESDVINASIKVDTEGPQINNFIINEGDVYTKALSREVKITIDAQGADSIYLSNESIDLLKPVNWIPYTDTLTWQLMDQDGVLTVHGLLKDKAGNVSMEVNDHIILDRVPPEFTRVFVNNNARFCNQTQVQVRLIAREAAQVKVSNYPSLDSAQWMPYTNLITEWHLDSTREGRKIVYAWFKDKAGNISDAAADEIILDRVPPEGIDVGFRYESISADEVFIVVKASDPKTMQWTFADTFENSEWQKYEKEFKIKLPENNNNEIPFYIRFRDEAENNTKVFEKMIIRKKEDEQQE